MQQSGHPDNPQMVERYIWTVVLDDGTVMNEYRTPTEHLAFGNVPIDRVVRLMMVPNGWLGITGQSFVVGCDPEQGIQPVMFRSVAMNVQTGESVRWHVFGTKQLVNGKSVTTFLYLSNNGNADTDALLLSHDKLEIG